MNKLVDGKIPAGQECPYKDICPSVIDTTCGHKGTEHKLPYSCGYARLFKIMEKVQ